MPKVRGVVILAGGRSTRFGSTDKATAFLAGRAMIRHVIDRLDPITDELVINCRETQRERIERCIEGISTRAVFAIDPEPDLGPVAGIATGLAALDRADVSFVVACDMPFVEPTVVEALFEAIGTADAAVPQVDDEWLEPTHAVYRTEPMIRACRDTLASGDHRIRGALERLTVNIVPANAIASPDQLQAFTNINTREEFAAAADQLDDTKDA